LVASSHLGFSCTQAAKGPAGLVPVEI
jgi:hypothetical protein